MTWPNPQNCTSYIIPVLSSLTFFSLMIRWAIMIGTGDLEKKNVTSSAVTILAQPSSEAVMDRAEKKRAAYSVHLTTTSFGPLSFCFPQQYSTS